MEIPCMWITLSSQTGNGRKDRNCRQEQRERLEPGTRLRGQEQHKQQEGGQPQEQARHPVQGDPSRQGGQRQPEQELTIREEWEPPGRQARQEERELSSRRARQQERELPGQQASQEEPVLPSRKVREMQLRVRGQRLTVQRLEELLRGPVQQEGREQPEARQPERLPLMVTVL